MLNNLVNKIIDSNKIVFFTGAGASTESGIPDFRSADGLYSDDFAGYSPEKILSHSFFYENTEIFYNYLKKKLIYKDAKPNKCHYAISELENLGYDVKVITQNIDGLHQIAGNSNVYPVHGSLNNFICTKCFKTFNLDYVLEVNGTVPECDECNSMLKPDVVLYEEQLNQLTLMESVKAMAEADVLFVIGSSLTVYPAAGLVNYYKGDTFVIINKAVTAFDDKADYIFHDKCGVVMERIIKEIKNIKNNG